jgi:membrane-bound lytic murein transglycosylase D
MHSKIALPLIVLLASGCAQIPDTPGESAFGEAVPGVVANAPVAVSAPEVAPPIPGSSATPAEPVIAGPVAAPPMRTTTRLSRAEHAAARAAAAKAAEAAEAAAPSNSVWTRITRGFAMAPFDSELVREWENWYASRPDYVARMIDRSTHFLFHIVEQVEKRGMPTEIALLPMIESAYNPVAYSRSHASGIWQFIPSTGKDFGLRQNWWYDGRRDVIAATNAALDYLEKLHGMFGDWQLALASYNWGEGAVSRAIERNRAKGLPTDYESLTMPPETRGYIPKLMAVKNIVLNPARFGLEIADIPNEPYFEMVTLKRHIDVKLAARFAEMPLEEFKFLNPGHNKPVIRAGESERIVLPKHTVATFRANLAKHDRPLVSWDAVTLRRGQKVERVAAEHGITLAELKQPNGLQNQKKLVPGQPLLVPAKSGADPQLPDLPVTPVPVSIPKAVQAAKAAAAANKTVQVKGSASRPVVQRAAQRAAAQKAAAQKAAAQRAGAQKAAAQKSAAQKPAKPPVRQLRAENGKQVKVIAPKTAAKKETKREKVASR